MRLERRHPCLQRRGFRGVKRRMHVTVFRVGATLTQARMPAVQSAERDASVPDF